MNLWNEIKAWMYAPLNAPLNVTTWFALLILSATIAYAWSRILDHVLEE
jgi:hypothetical protein